MFLEKWRGRTSNKAWILSLYEITGKWQSWFHNFNTSSNNKSRSCSDISWKMNWIIDKRNESIFPMIGLVARPSTRTFTKRRSFRKLIVSCRLYAVSQSVWKVVNRRSGKEWMAVIVFRFSWVSVVKNSMIYTRVSWRDTCYKWIRKGKEERN